MAKSKSTAKRSQPSPSHIRELADSWRRERPEVDHVQLLLAIYIMRLGRVLDVAYDRMCRAQFGVSGQEMRVLFALRRAGPPFSRRPTELFKALLVTSGAMTKQVDRLAASGHVVRTPHPKIARGAQVTLTAKGLAAADAAIDVLSSRLLIAEAIEAMGRPDIEKACRLMGDMMFSLEGRSPNKG